MVVNLKSNTEPNPKPDDSQNPEISKNTNNDIIPTQKTNIENTTKLNNHPTDYSYPLDVYIGTYNSDNSKGVYHFTVSPDTGIMSQPAKGLHGFSHRKARKGRNLFPDSKREGNRPCGRNS